MLFPKHFDVTLDAKVGMRMLQCIPYKKIVGQSTLLFRITLQSG